MIKPRQNGRKQKHMCVKSWTRRLNSLNVSLENWSLKTYVTTKIQINEDSFDKLLFDKSHYVNFVCRNHKKKIVYLLLSKNKLYFLELVVVNRPQTPTFDVVDKCDCMRNDDTIILMKTTLIKSR